ncbi:MAG: hypothetical protein RMJ00_04410 [Nitrososphaerota archaeon]|nr:hypothetical protein [Candidatus Bathyarchaeota archaeon]MDW8061922.1 hypothetical protein [Nitrososphaerota archaeon]
MSFYVEFTKTLPLRIYSEYIVFERPRLFSAIFTALIIAASILRVTALLDGGLTSSMVILITAALPHSLIEAYSIYNAIYKVLTKRLTVKVLAGVYLLLLLAAILEVASMQVLSSLKTRISSSIELRSW